MLKVLRMLSGVAAAALRRQPRGWQDLPERIVPGDRVRLREMPDYKGTTGVVCHVGASRADKLHIWLDAEQRRPARHGSRSDVIGWAPADSRSMDVLDRGADFSPWTPLMRDG